MSTAIPLAAAEARVEAQSAGLRRELGMADIVLAQILFIVVPDFFGTAVKAGASHVVFWLLAIALFFIPQAIVVSHLNRLIPLEGGLYQWARLGFGDATGFMVAWNLWLYVVLMVAGIGLLATTYVAYAAGPALAWLGASKVAIGVATVAIVAALMIVSLLGLGVGKWVNNFGSVVTLGSLAVLIALPIANAMRGGALPNRGFSLVMPRFSLFHLSAFSKMTFGALSGFEYIAIFGGECRNPGRTLARSVVITAPVIALLYIFGTGAILSFVRPEDVNVIGPIPQALSIGLASLGVVREVAPIAILLLLCNYLATYNLSFSANARLPMVAGWDKLLPEWFTRLHPRRKTPVNSILFAGTMTVGVALAVLAGVREQEAFELLQVCAFTCYGLAYLVMFALPLAGFRREKLNVSVWLRAAAASRFLVTLLFVALSIFPIIDVESRTAYTLKTVAVILGANLLGAGVLLAERRLTRRAAA
ncbi:MAG: APC family permease [Candidatus Acidiferrales bacterium]